MESYRALSSPWHLQGWAEKGPACAPWAWPRQELWRDQGWSMGGLKLAEQPSGKVAPATPLHGPALPFPVPLLLREGSCKEGDES